MQFTDFPQYGIDRNTFRFEVKSKQSKCINSIPFPSLHDVKHGLSLIDLLKLENYNVLFQSILNEWENILIINLDLKNQINTPEYWSKIIADKYRHQFRIKKEKYYKELTLKENLQHLIKCKIIDKIIYLQDCTYSTQKTATNREKVINQEPALSLINLESVQFNSNNAQVKQRCKVTNLDISNQRKGSKFIREKTLKTLKENDPKTFEKLEIKYLTEKMKTQPLEKQFYHIAKNIRDQESNPRNNRKIFEKRNYQKTQMQFNFKFTS